MNLAKRHCGMWYDPSKDGQGVSVIVLPTGGVIMTWYLAAVPGLSDAPTWLTAQRTVDDTDTTLTLFQCVPASNEFVRASYVAVGRCAFNAIDDGHIVASLEIDFRDDFSPPPPTVHLEFHLVPAFVEAAS